jgi:hypothetical protein
VPSDQDDDQDEVALTGPDDDGDDGDDGRVLPGSGHRAERPARVLSQSTREMFKKAAASLKSQLDDEDDDLYDSVGSEDDPVDDPAPSAAAVAATTTPSAPAPTAATPAAAAPSLDPAIIAERERLSQRAAELDRREADITARSVGPLEAFRSRYLDDEAGAMRDLLKEVTGAATDDELNDAVADLVVGLSVNVLKLNAADDVKQRVESRRVMRQLKAHKAEQAREKVAAAKAAEQAQHTEKARAAIGAIGRELDAVKATYPHLMAEDDPAGFVWDVIQHRHAESGEVLSWDAAAALANDSFKRYADAYIAKRRHLLAPPASAGTGAATTPNGDATRDSRGNQGRPRRTVTNDMAAAAPARATAETEPTRDERPLTNEERRARTKQRMRQAFQAGQRDGNA